MDKKDNKLIKIILSGEGGQGIQTIAQILSEAAFASNYHVSYIPHYGVEMRMGISFAYLQISTEKIALPKFSYADILAIMSRRQLEIPRSFLNKNTLLINAIDLDKILVDHGITQNSFNMLVMGIIVNYLFHHNMKIGHKLVVSLIKEKLKHKNNLKDNLMAFDLGIGLDKKCFSKSFADIKKPNLTPVEAADAKKVHVRFPNLCKGCGLCVEKCPVNALTWSKEHYNYISHPIPEVDINKCTACKICQNICPDCAISVKIK